MKAISVESIFIRKHPQGSVLAVEVFVLLVFLDSNVGHQFQSQWLEGPVAFHGCDHSFAVDFLHSAVHAVEEYFLVLFAEVLEQFCCAHCGIASVFSLKLSFLIWGKNDWKVRLLLTLLSVFT